jgi:lactate dehydrogenase-like 2-hydroxyacid dehydrogenase
MFLILGALRNFNYGMHHLRQGSFKGSPLPRLGHDPEGKVLGILGMGGIGRNLKKKAEAFGMKVVYHNRRQLSEELAAGAKYVSFEELLSGSDVISLNLPLNVGSSLLFFYKSALLTRAETHPAHHRQARIRKDEGRRRHCEHCPWRSDGRGRPRSSPR